MDVTVPVAGWMSSVEAAVTRRGRRYSVKYSAVSVTVAGPEGSAG